MWNLVMYNASAVALPFQPCFPSIYQTPQNPKQAKSSPGRAMQVEPSVPNYVTENNLLSREPWQNSAETFTLHFWDKPKCGKYVSVCKT